MHELIGQIVMHAETRQKGKIIDVNDGLLRVEYYDRVSSYSFPACLADTLILKDKALREKYRLQGSSANFDQFKMLYSKAVLSEIAYLRKTGGKKYRIVDGVHLQTRDKFNIYSFDTDSELHFPDGTAIKLWFPEKIVPAIVVSCEEFTIIIQSDEFLGKTIETVEFTAEPWQLMEALIERIQELSPDMNSIAYELACCGRPKMSALKQIGLGQDLALKKSGSQPITFIWGPPGTGKTTTLARIALEHIHNGERVLMVSYSNVSVDGAVLKVANMDEQEPGQIIRYGYPRVKELVESNTLTSYSYVLSQNPELEDTYRKLAQKRNKLKKDDSRRIQMLSTNKIE